MTQTNRPSDKPANIDPDQIAHRDNRTCQKCGRQLSQDDTAMVHFIGRNPDSPAHYETRCEPCSRTFIDKCDRMIRYLFTSILTLFAGPTFAVGLWFTLSTINPLTLVNRGMVDYLLYTYIGGPAALIFWVVAAIIYIQILIWIEPPNGIIYRVASWVQEDCLPKVVRKTQSISSRLANK